MTFSAFVKPVLRALSAVHRGLEFLWTAPIRLYRRFLSPLKGPGSCRFTPTCSRYALDAVREWGILAGTALALWRVLRCNPFSEGGYDPVPTRREAARKLGISPRAERPQSQPPTER